VTGTGLYRGAEECRRIPRSLIHLALDICYTIGTGDKNIYRDGFRCSEGVVTVRVGRFADHREGSGGAVCDLESCVKNKRRGTQQKEDEREDDQGSAYRLLRQTTLLSVQDIPLTDFD